MSRPNRLYLDSKNRYYYIVDNKRKYIKVPPGMSQKQIQTINIKNVIGNVSARRMKRKKKRIRPVYSKKLVPKDDMIKSGITYQGLPTYFFTPQKSFVDLGNISTRSNDTNTEKLIDLLKGLKPVIDVDKKIKIEIPEPERKPKFTPMKPESRPTEDGTPTFTPMKPEPGSKLFETIKSEYEKSKEFIRKAREAPDLPVPTDKILLEKLKADEKKRDRRLISQLMNFEYIEKNERPTTFDDWKRIARTNVGVDKEYSSKDSLQNAIRRILREDLKSIGRNLEDESYMEPPGGGGKDDGDDGLYNDQISTIMKKRIKNFVPVVASDKVDELLLHVEPGDKFFAAVVNTEPSSSSGRHWRCIIIDNRDDFPSAEYFDPLAETERGPEESLISVMKRICKIMNPEKYCKFKYNLLRRQSYNKSNCGFHVMRFIEDRFNGIPFSEASGYDAYMKKQKGSGYEPIDDSIDGEGDLKSYENKIKKQFKSYL